LLYVNLTVTTKQKPIVDTQKIMRRESKYTTIRNHQITKEESKRRKEQRITTKTTRKQQNGNKYTLINNYFKYKWTKCSNQKTQSG